MPASVLYYCIVFDIFAAICPFSFVCPMLIVHVTMIVKVYSAPVAYIMAIMYFRGYYRQFLNIWP